jgi:hypothetical protein
MIPSVLRYVRRALTTPKVQRVEISMKGITVEREMPPEAADDPVVPVGSDDIDIGYLLGTIELLSHPFDPKQHAMYALYAGSQTLATKGRELFAVVAPGWPLFAAWLGVEATKDVPKFIFGTKLLIVPSNVTNERVVLLGAKASALFVSDADLGIAIDLGV